MSVYIIVPAQDAVNNFTMLNYSTSKSFDSIRKNNLQTKYLFESKSDPPHSVFDQYKWYSESEILEELNQAEWQG